MLKTLAGVGISVLALATPALAANVYDAKGKLVGELISLEATDWTANPVYNIYNGVGEIEPQIAFSRLVLITEPNYGPQLVKVGRNGLVVESAFYFQTERDCSGLFFLLYNPSVDLVPHAQYDGQSLWVVDPKGAANYGVESALINGTCEPFLPFDKAVAAAPAHAVTVSFTPPFSVSRPKQDE